MKRLILILSIALALVTSGVHAQARACADKMFFASRAIYAVSRGQNAPCGVTVQFDNGDWKVEGSRLFQVERVSGDCTLWRGSHLTPRRGAVVVAVVRAANRCVLKWTADTAGARWRIWLIDITNWGE